MNGLGKLFRRQRKSDPVIDLKPGDIVDIRPFHQHSTIGFYAKVVSRDEYLAHLNINSKAPTQELNDPNYVPLYGRYHGVGQVTTYFTENRRDVTKVDPLPEIRRLMKYRDNVDDVIEYLKGLDGLNHFS